MRSQVCMITRMSWSITTIPQWISSRVALIASIRSSLSLSSKPAAGSSISRWSGFIARARAFESGDGVDQRRLARAVGPDQAQDVALAHDQVDAVDRGQGSEADRYSIGGESGVARGRALRLLIHRRGSQRGDRPASRG